MGELIYKMGYFLTFYFNWDTILLLLEKIFFYVMIKSWLSLPEKRKNQK